MTERPVLHPSFPPSCLQATQAFFTNLVAAANSVGLPM